ncbi:MAG: nucleotide exchange factor GrpE [Prevotella sp.]|nr:nucleotide exchange factor GrpE [Prevotella sp.]
MKKEQEINIEDEETLNLHKADTEASDKTADADVEVAEDSEVNDDSDDVEVVAGGDPLANAQAEIEELKTQLLYKAAEFDNYRKRMLKERAELILNGSERAVKELLPVLDDMERAIAAGKKTEDPQVLREGMELIYNKFWKTFEKLGVTVIETDNCDFSTDLHEAVALVPGMGDDKKGKIIDCTQKGYKLNDKVIRFAQVAVGQ